MKYEIKIATPEGQSVSAHFIGALSSIFLLPFLLFAKVRANNRRAMFICLSRMYVTRYGTTDAKRYRNVMVSLQLGGYILRPFICYTDYKGKVLLFFFMNISESFEPARFSINSLSTSYVL